MKKKKRLGWKKLYKKVPCFHKKIIGGLKNSNKNTIKTAKIEDYRQNMPKKHPFR
jgi:hypothetical protein